MTALQTAKRRWIVAGVEVDNGALHVSFRDGVIPGGSAQAILTIRPLIVTGSPASPIAWACSSRAVPSGMEAVGQDRTTIVKRDRPRACN